MKTSEKKTTATPSAKNTQKAAQPFIPKGAASDSKQLAKKSASEAGVKDVPVSSEVVEIGTDTFSPSQKVKDEIIARKSKGLDVRVLVKGLTGEGIVKIRANSSKGFDSVGKGSMPLLNQWTTMLGGMHINFSVKNSVIKGGYASFKPGGGSESDWLKTIKNDASLLGGLGLKLGNLPDPVNEFENGKLLLGVENLTIEVGGFVTAQMSLTVENMNKPKIDITGDIDIKGVVKGQLKIDNTKEKLAGQVSLGVDYKSFSGSATVKYNPEGAVDIEGKASYNADKLAGEISFTATDLETANRFAKDAIAAAGGKENVQNAPPPGPVPLPKEGAKKRAIAATGQLGFNLTDWFAGTVNVVVDGKGAVTVIGKIAPPAEITLFKQKDWEKQIINFEAKAYYGIPLVGNLNLFASIGLFALARLGPAKIYQIEILGTYSTDPEIQKNIQISGSINISAYAGLRLRAEGGAGIELVGHDIKFGIGLNADVGVKAYADARPTIGYRDPGQFYISGTLEMVAQPMLGLGGDFFIKLDSPWWSPAPDKKWLWPLFSKEWPLGDPIGISATVKDYVLGSGAVPEIELKKPEFDPSKFMTSMVDDKLPGKSGGQGSGHGTFKEDGSVPKPVVPPKKPAPKKPDAKPAKKGAAPKGGKSAAPDPKAAKDKDNAQRLQQAARLLSPVKSKGPLTRGELDKETDKIKSQVSGIKIKTKGKGSKWIVTPKAGGGTGKDLELEAKAGGIKSAISKWWKSKKPFKTKSGEDHQIYFSGEGEKAVPMVASKDPKPILSKLEEFRDIANTSDVFKGKKNKNKKDEVLAKINGTKNLLEKNPDDKRIVTNMQELFNVFEEKSDKKKKDGNVVHVHQKIAGDPTGTDVGKSMRADWLSASYIKENPGSPPGSGQDKLMNLMVSTSEKGITSANKFIRGHLLNENLSGKGVNENLFPITANANSQHLRSTEAEIKKWLGIGKEGAIDETNTKYAFYEVKVEVKEVMLSKSRKKEDNWIDSTFKCRAELKDEKGDVKSSFMSSIDSVYTEKKKAERFDLLENKD